MKDRKMVEAIGCADRKDAWVMIHSFRLHRHPGSMIGWSGLPTPGQAAKFKKKTAKR
jgi:hypothetical protein